MGMATGERVQSGRPGRLGALVLEGEVARGEASVVHATRLADSLPSGPGGAAPTAASAGPARLAAKAYDPRLRALHGGAARFEQTIDPRLARVRRADETGELPRDRLYRVTDLVRGAAATLETLGSLRATVAFWVEVARALAVAHERGLAHGHLHPGHALVLPDRRPLVVDGGVVPTPSAARERPATVAFLAPEALEDLLEDRLPQATPERDVYGLAASLVGALGGRAPGSGALARPGAGLEALLDAKRGGKPPVIAASLLSRHAVDQRALGVAIARALDPEPARRHKDAAALAEELVATLTPATGHPTPEAPEKRP